MAERKQSRGELERAPAAEEQIEYHRKVLKDLELELAERELELATLTAQLSTFQVRYHKVLGARYSRLDDLIGRIATAWVRARDGDRHERHEVWAEVPPPADGTRPGNGQRVGEASPLPRFAPSPTAKRLFRKLARQIHPDLAVDPEERERRTRLMVTANLAYERGDTEALKRLLSEWEGGSEVVVGESPSAELLRILRQINQVRARLEVITTELRELEASPMLQLLREVEEADRKGWDLLARMADELDRLIAKAEEELRLLEEEGVLPEG